MPFEHVQILIKGTNIWNQWRKEHTNIKPDLRRAPLSGRDLRGADLRFVDLENAELDKARLGDLFPAQRANLRNCDLSGATLKEANLIGVDLGYSSLGSADLRGASMRMVNMEYADLTKASLEGADLRNSKLYFANFRDADLKHADLRKANLELAILVGTDLRGADMTGALVYGISAWDVKVDKKTVQIDLVITRQGPTIKVDNIKIAQFLHTIFDTAELGNLVNTMTGRAVLILGRFTPERIAILEAIAQKLRGLEELPIIFNFDKPIERSTSETVRILAGLSKFIIADLTDPKSSPYESRLVVPDITVPFFPIIERGQSEFSMFNDLYDYDWLLPGFEYQNVGHLIDNLEKIRKEALLKRDEIRNRRKHRKEGFRKMLD